MNILFLTNEINEADGVSSHLFYLIQELKKNPAINIFLVSGGGDAAGKFIETGITVCTNKIFTHNNRSPVNFLNSILFLKRFIKRNEIHFIHSHNHYAANIAGYCPKNDSIKTIQTLHGIIPETGRLKHFNANYYITVNDYIRDYLVVTKNVKKEEVFIIHNGIKFKKSIPEKLNHKKKIVAASRLEEKKGLEVFIEAVSMLPEGCRDKAEFIISGSGSLKENLMKMNIELKAGINFAEDIFQLQGLLDTTDIFVIPSEEEGFPITLLEAASSKNLIITSDFEGVNSVLPNEEYGIIFRKRSPEDLKEKIKFAMDNPEIIKEKAENFFMYAKDNFSSDRMAEKHIEVYNQVIQNQTKI